jgi:hypothetical protein
MRRRYWVPRGTPAALVERGSWGREERSLDLPERLINTQVDGDVIRRMPFDLDKPNTY